MGNGTGNEPLCDPWQHRGCHMCGRCGSSTVTDARMPWCKQQGTACMSRQLTQGQLASPAGFDAAFASPAAMPRRAEQIGQHRERIQTDVCPCQLGPVCRTGLTLCLVGEEVPRCNDPSRPGKECLVQVRVHHVLFFAQVQKIGKAFHSGCLRAHGSVGPGSRAEHVTMQWVRIPGTVLVRFPLVQRACEGGQWWGLGQGGIDQVCGALHEEKFCRDVAQTPNNSP